MSNTVSLRAKKGLLIRYVDALNGLIATSSGLLTCEPIVRALVEALTALKAVVEALSQLTDAVDIINIEAKRASLHEPETSGAHWQGSVHQTRVELPAIPIPKFAGKIGEYDTFWAQFEANVHSQNLANLQKFNYLINALRGEAREAVKRYAITEENYPLALRLLWSKHGDRSRLVRHLQSRLETASAKGSVTRN
ncbi:hypothetical protein Y032_0774g2247 [Ancylostoma ceylanicum]|uniref:Uncharacterized protein n=1 Tax=Ancylostoma ceylanicum TaxID=53326 RepID=A0A016WF83_9BILA|nr:hypothetical protein Y032_0774g2247 [Ancylostoma ceylanicum]